MKKYSRGNKLDSNVLKENNTKIVYSNHSLDFRNPENIINNYKRDNIEWPINDKLKFKPLMSIIDARAFCYFMHPKNIYFEFGSGGSTNIASYYNLTVYSVESDIKWQNTLKKK